MGIGVLKKEDGFWLSFQSSKGKYALVHVGKTLNNGTICNAAILETCEECASKNAELPATPTNTASLKLPGIFKAETHVLNEHQGASINEREKIASIVRETYEYIAGQLQA